MEVRRFPLPGNLFPAVLRALLPALLGIAAALAGPAGAAGETLGTCRIRLIGGKEVSGAILEIARDRVRIDGVENPIPIHEVRELRFRDDDAAGPPALDPRARAFLEFTGGEALPGRILDSDGKSIRLLVRCAPFTSDPAGEPAGEIAIPLGATRAFRLREPHGSDRIFEETLAGPPPRADQVFVRRGESLVRVEGVFRGLDENELTLEYQGRPQRIRRDRVLGVVLARVAGAPLERGYEGILVLEGGGRLPVLLDRISAAADGAGPRLRVEVHGMPWEVEIRRVLKIDFASDRIRFLSDLEPARAEETPLLGGRFPHRRDLSVGGGPIRLDGVEYRKGIGVHARCALEYVLEDGFATFAATVGIDEAAAGRLRSGPAGLRCRAAVRVLGDGRTLYEGEVSGSGSPIEIVVPIPAIKVLRLETDYGDDGTDLGDHVDWAEARVVKPARSSE